MCVQSKLLRRRREIGVLRIPPMFLGEDVASSWFFSFFFASVNRRRVGGKTPVPSSHSDLLVCYSFSVSTWAESTVLRCTVWRCEKSIAWVGIFSFFWVGGAGGRLRLTLQFFLWSLSSKERISLVLSGRRKCPPPPNKQKNYPYTQISYVFLKQPQISSSFFCPPPQKKRYLSSSRPLLITR